MFEIIPSKININFVGYRNVWIGVSILATIATIVLLFTKGLNYGIDFKGGAEVQLNFKQAVDVSELRKNLENSELKNIAIQALGSGENKEFLVKLGAEDQNLQKVGAMVEDVLTKKYSKDQFEVARVDVVGPQAGEQLRKSGLLSMLYALLCIFIYVGIRFDSRYSPGAVIALIHDSIITLGVFVVTQKEFSLQILAAILTIIGYSNNDTIIVFDRVRETVKAFPNRSFVENVNRSINETLGRTMLTSLNTLLVTVALMVFGSGVIKDFAFTMTVGIVVGTYSSIFIASPTLIYFTHYFEKKAKKAKNALSASPKGAHL